MMELYRKIVDVNNEGKEFIVAVSEKNELTINVNEKEVSIGKVTDGKVKLSGDYKDASKWTLMTSTEPYEVKVVEEPKKPATFHVVVKCTDGNTYSPSMESTIRAIAECSTSEIIDFTCTKDSITIGYAEYFEGFDKVKNAITILLRDSSGSPMDIISDIIDKGMNEKTCCSDGPGISGLTVRPNLNKEEMSTFMEEMKKLTKTGDVKMTPLGMMIKQTGSEVPESIKKLQDLGILI